MPTGDRRPLGGMYPRPFAERFPPGTTGWQGDPNEPVAAPPRGPRPPEPSPPPGQAPGGGTAPEPVPTPPPPAGPGREEEVALPTDVVGLLQLAVRELRAIRGRLKQVVQRGLIYSLTMTIQTVDPVPVEFGQPLFSVNITCDGAGIVQYRLPNSGSSNWIDLRPNEQITFAAVEPVFTTTAFRVLGAPATIRVVGLY